MTIAVIAGTPVDTQMGVELLNGKGVEALGFPISRTPEEQTAFQVGSQSAREEAVGAILDQITARPLTLTPWRRPGVSGPGPPWTFTASWPAGTAGWGSWPPTAREPPGWSGPW